MLCLFLGETRVVSTVDKFGSLPRRWKLVTIVVSSTTFDRQPEAAYERETMHFRSIQATDAHALAVPPKTRTCNSFSHTHSAHLHLHFHYK